MLMPSLAYGVLSENRGFHYPGIFRGPQKTRVEKGNYARIQSRTRRRELKSESLCAAEKASL